MQQGSDNSNENAPQSIRVTVTLDRSSYDFVLRLAKTKRVSAAWIIRDAVEKYRTADVPLLADLS